MIEVPVIGEDWRDEQPPVTPPKPGYRTSQLQTPTSERACVIVCGTSTILPSAPDATPAWASPMKSHFFLPIAVLKKIEEMGEGQIRPVEDDDLPGAEAWEVRQSPLGRDLTFF